MRPEIVIVGPLYPPTQARLEELFTTHRLWEAGGRKALLCRVAALQTGAIGAAGLDVFAGEPNVPTALTALDNVVLMPHAGSATHGTRAAMGELMTANLLAHFAGRPLPTPVV